MKITFSRKFVRDANRFLFSLKNIGCRCDLDLIFSKILCGNTIAIFIFHNFCVRDTIAYFLALNFYSRCDCVFFACNFRSRCDCQNCISIKLRDSFFSTNYKNRRESGFFLPNFQNRYDCDFFALIFGMQIGLRFFFRSHFYEVGAMLFFSYPILIA